MMQSHAARSLLSFFLFIHSHSKLTFPPSLAKLQTPPIVIEPGRGPTLHVPCKLQIHISFGGNNRKLNLSRLVEFVGVVKGLIHCAAKMVS